MAYKDFQQFVGQVPAIGLPGQEVTLNQAVYTPYQYVSDGTVAAGTFAFAEATPVKDKSIAYSKKSGGKFLGFVPRNQSTLVNAPYISNSNVYPEGAPVPIAIRGQFYFEVPSSGAPNEGESVLCDPATGAVTFGAAGTANDTGWVVHVTQGAASPAAAGDIVIIENWGLNNKPTA